MSDVLYLYGFVPAAAPAPPRELHGIDDVPVELVPLDSLHAVISRLPAQAYRAERIEQRLEELSWVAERGLAHERVVAWFVDHAEILPAPLFTLYSSAPALQAALAPRVGELEAQLERLRGRREWDLKVCYRREQLEAHAGSVSEPVRALDEEIAAAAPGRRFLLERKRAELIKNELSRAARRAAEQLLDEVRPHAERIVALAPPREAGDLPVLLAAALLLARDAELPARTFLERRAGELEHLGFSVQLTGPWAPYRFLEPARADG